MKTIERNEMGMQAESNSDLCHRCKWGGVVVARCNCPTLQTRSAWYKTIPRTWTNADTVGRARGLAEAKGLKDFNPAAYMAVTAAVVNGECEFFNPEQEQAESVLQQE